MDKKGCTIRKVISIGMTQRKWLSLIQGNGVDCVFLTRRLGEEVVGIKTFGSEKNRNEHLHRQTFGYEAGIGPKPGPAIKITVVHDCGLLQIRHAYLTEVVQTFGNRGPGQASWSTDGVYDSDEDLYHRSCEDVGELMYERDMLEKEASEVFRDITEVRDLHWGNVGRGKNGKMVIIDFGFGCDAGGTSSVPPVVDVDQEGHWGKVGLAWREA